MAFGGWKMTESNLGISDNLAPQKRLNSPSLFFKVLQDRGQGEAGHSSSPAVTLGIF